jgi:hypothetical protein
MTYGELKPIVGGLECRVRITSNTAYDLAPAHLVNDRDQKVLFRTGGLT